MLPEKRIDWDRNDYSRIPYWVFHDPALYAQEMERVFRGRAWLFLGLDAEIPEPGDFRTSLLGETPVVYQRDEDGGVKAFVNRCAHRGAVVRREACGNAKEHICVYHQWCYDRAGNLIGVPFEKGLAGKGGMSKEFRRAEHGLQKLRVESFHGVLFANFAPDPEPLADYLGEAIGGHIARLFRAPVKVLGYQRQHVRGNWKLYAENSRDQYHGSLLHRFLGTFMTRTTTEGGLKLDPRHRHSLVYSMPGQRALAIDAERARQDIVHNVERFRNMEMLRHIDEFGDTLGNAICAVFPNAVFQRLRNSLATRQLRPKGPDEFELLWTIFGFTDDSEEMTRHRLLQANIGGPAGYVSLEDGEAIELVHKATKNAGSAASVIEMGDTGEIPDHVTTRMNELSLRGFWSYYAELMGSEPAAAVR